MFEKFAGKHVLLLQGPVGPFFHWLAQALQHQRVRITKVNFNAADSWFYSASARLAYRDSLDNWHDALSDIIQRKGVDAVFVFGDSRPYHVVARQVARQLGIPLFAFEEGYLRPDYITFEEGGTNFQSRIPRQAEFFASLPAQEGATATALAAPTKVGQTFWLCAWYATVYALILTVCSGRYPQYRHHRDWNAVRQAAIWWRSAGRKILHFFRELGLLERIIARPGHFFLVPLQVHDDYQIRNSTFESVPAFIEEVVASFAHWAPKDAFLIFKHHPRDRGFRDYRQYLHKLSKQYALSGRVVYVHDLHLPTLLAGARGSVVVNSTVGLSSLVHGTPVKCLDDCVYAAGASPQPLSEFWSTPTPVDRAVVAQLLLWLKKNVLVNGSFYRSEFWRVGQRAPSEQPSTLSKPDISSPTV